MHRGINYLLFMLVAVGAKFPNLQRVCESDGSDADQLYLNYDQVTATLNVSLVDRKNAVFTSYKIHLSADWNRTQVDEKACQDAHFYPHSDYDIHLKNDFPVRFLHVYSGFYRLTVIPWINNSISFQAISVTFITHTTRRPIAIQNWTTHFIIHPLPRFSSIIVQFLPAAIEYEFDFYEVLLSGCDQVSLSLTSGYTSICKANQSSPECTFESLAAGNYCAFVRPLDNRCDYGNVWQVKDHCIVHSDLIELTDSPHSKNSMIPDGSVLRVENHSATVLAGVMITFVCVAAIFVGALLYRISRRRTILIPDNRKGLVSNSSSSTLTHIIKPKNILLLWFRDNSQLIQQVDLLKTQLRNRCNAKIVDIYDDDLFNELSVDPVRWLNDLMSSQNLRILVIGSCRLEQLSQIDHTDVELDLLEGLVLYAIKQLWLRKAACHSLYSTTFLVRFTNIPYDGRSSDLTPFRCFLLPVHCAELLIYINS